MSDPNSPGSHGEIGTGLDRVTTISVMAVAIQIYQAITGKRDVEFQLNELQKDKEAINGRARIMREQAESVSAQVNSYTSRLDSEDKQRHAKTEKITSSHSNEALLSEMKDLIKEKSKLTDTLEKTTRAKKEETKNKNQKRKSSPSGRKKRGLK